MGLLDSKMLHEPEEPVSKRTKDRKKREKERERERERRKNEGKKKRKKTRGSRVDHLPSFVSSNSTFSDSLPFPLLPGPPFYALSNARYILDASRISVSSTRVFSYNL